MNMNADYFEIDLLRLIKALWRRVWLLILAGILCGGIAFSYASLVIKPRYESSVLMYVNNSSFSLGNTSFSFSTSDLSAAQSLVDTYIVILESRTTLNAVIERADLDYSYEQLLDMIEAFSVDSTEIFEIVVNSTDPVEAMNIANTIADVLPAKVSAVVDGSSVRVVDYAVAAKHKVSPNITSYTLLGFMAGVGIAAAAVVFIETQDDLIHDEDYLNITYDIPVLACIPNLQRSRESGNRYSASSKKR